MAWCLSSSPTRARESAIPIPRSGAAAAAAAPPASASTSPAGSPSRPEAGSRSTGRRWAAPRSSSGCGPAPRRTAVGPAAPGADGLSVAEPGPRALARPTGGVLAGERGADLLGVLPRRMLGVVALPRPEPEPEAVLRVARDDVQVQVRHRLADHVVDEDHRAGRAEPVLHRPLQALGRGQEFRREL